MGGISEESVAENTANETETQPTQSTNPESKPEETKIEAPVKILPLYVTAIDRVSFERTANDQNLLQAVVLFGITCDAKVDPSTLVAQIQYRLPYGPQQSAVRLVDVDLGVREIQTPKSEELVRQQFCVCVPLDDPNLKNLPPQPVVHYTILLKGTTDPKANSLQSVPILSSESPQRPPFNTFKVQFKLTNNNNPNPTSSEAFPTTVKDLITTCDRAADSVATEVENVLQSAAKVFDKLPGIASSWLNRFEKFMDEVDKDLKGNNTTSNTQPVNPPPSNVNTQPTFVPIQPQPLNPYGQYYQPGAKPAERPAPVQTQSEPPKQQDQAAQNDVNQNSAFSISD